MRSRFTSGFALVAILFVAACADQSQPTSPLLGDALQSASTFPAGAPAACTSADNKIIAMGLGSPSQQLLREGVAFFYTKNQPVQGWKKFIDIIKHLDSDNPDVVALTILLVQCGGGNAPPANPAGNEDVFVGIILNTKKVYEFKSSHNDFLVYFPANFFTGPVIVLGTRQFDNTSVNDEDLQEYPLKVDITASPPGLENTSGIMAIVKVCAYGESEGGGLEHDLVNAEDLVLFQQGTGVLNEPGANPSSALPCDDTDELDPPVIITLGNIADQAYASFTRALRGAGGLALSVITPRQLFASAMLVDGGVGGETNDFSSLFAPVEEGCGESCDFRRRNEKVESTQNGAGLKGVAIPPKVKK